MIRENKDESSKEDPSLGSYVKEKHWLKPFDPENEEHKNPNIKKE